MSEGKKLVEEAVEFYNQLTNSVYKNDKQVTANNLTDEEVKNFSDSEIEKLSERILVHFNKTFPFIISINSYKDKISIDLSDRLEVDNLGISDKKIIKYNNTLKITIELLQAHQIDLTYETIGNALILGETNNYDPYFLNQSSIIKTKKKKQRVDIKKDQDKFLDILLDEGTIITIAFCFNCIDILKETEIWSLEKRKKYSSISNKNEKEYQDYIFKIIEPELEYYIKIIISKNSNYRDMKYEEVKNLVYLKVLEVSIFSKYATYLFEFMENEEEFKGYLFGTLKNISNDKFFEEFKNISKIDLFEDIVKSNKSSQPSNEEPEKKIIETENLDMIYSCLFKAANDIPNKNRRKVITIFLELAITREDVSIQEIHKLFFPNMNRSTFYAHKHYGMKYIAEKCKNYYFQ